ncbi:MAG: Asp-tRNA(Asn)/Glu-tRNA(Gln) amidotransferase subunit GatC [bacterium]|nr:Asp-tRNA(Asn)/Glu-tRNA(Gln) amidotransferase subunit GatC [bacterium]MDZ4286187.1 Asp-tRNA(Asn)/Glu-tRNA(Gln) amidotransferase subunit GatC [Candidatus Sungbacteria bacterium]
MALSSEEVEHIAKLARLELTAEEKKMFETELSGILSFVETLNEIDTAGIEPVNGGTLLKNVMRSDEQADAYMEKKSAKLVEAAAETKESLIKVKSVF